jgi:NAD(P)-dependent dehydrogenase (short-subunit alcohol dehydrogenase family)
MNRLCGQVAIVTGASSGIGRATAVLLAQEGAAVVLGARRAEALARVAEEVAAAGGRCSVLAGDVTDEAYCEALAAEAVSRFGRLDLAFNNAGALGPLGPSTEISATGWRQTLEVNLTGAFFCARYQIPHMLRQGGGSIVFTSSFVGHTAAFPGTAAYAASKAGLIGLAQTLAVEYGSRGVRVNAVLPGGTDTPMAREMCPDDAAISAVAKLHALGRIAAPAEIAQAVLFMASPEAAFVTGSAMRVDGGVSVFRA